MRVLICAIVVLAVCLCVSVDASPRHHSHNTSKPINSHRAVHPIHRHLGSHHGNADHYRPTVMNEENVALFDRVRKELEARNYSRPTGSPNGYRGVDISQWAGASTWGCLKQNGYDFGIVRNYMETCQIDPNGVHSVANAWAAGIAHVDIYLYPSWTCGVSAANQVNSAIESMGTVPFGQLWFDIEEGGAAGPNTDHAWLTAAVNQAVARIGAGRVGVYSSRYGWSVAMGNYARPGSFPIWYAHYDDNPSFSDWVSFAGWTSPSMKQFAGSATVCSFSVDLNYYP